MLERLLIVLGACLLVTSSLVRPQAAERAATGQIVVAGYGPERTTLEALARAFEKANRGSVITIKWDRNLKAVELVRSGQAQVAVTGEEDSELAGTPIAWDGIAVIVNFANPVREVTTQQVAALFSGTVTRWFEFGGGEDKVHLIQRPPDRNIRAAFERALGIVGSVPAAGKVIRSDQKVLSEVGGILSAVSYISLGAALEATTFGTPVRMLTIDGVEPGKPRVKDGQYKLRRPVLLLTKKQRPPLLDAFLGFARSKEGQTIVGETYVPYVPDGG